MHLVFWQAFSSAKSLLGTGVFPEAEGPEFDAAAACRYRERGVGASADVLCVDWSPFCTEHFAVAVADGTVGVYTAEASRPRLVLPAPSALPLLAVRWSCDRPSLLFALDAGSTVFVWDLMEAAKDSSSAPLASVSPILVKRLREQHEPQACGLAVPSAPGQRSPSPTRPRPALPVLGSNLTLGAGGFEQRPRGRRAGRCWQ